MKITEFYPCRHYIEIRKIIMNSLVYKNLIMRIQFYSYKFSPKHMRASMVEENFDVNAIYNKLKELGIPVRSIVVDVDFFISWINEYSDLLNFYKNHGEVKIEKLLEHYLTTTELDIKKGDVLIDIASATSPYANIIGRKLRTRTYSQDLIFEDGIHGTNIGGSAGHLPLQKNFADVLTLHCAYECFQGNDDIDFIIESERILKKGGRIGIVPLYLNETYFVKTGYLCDRSTIRVESEAKLIWRDDKWPAEPFSRHYSPAAFSKRIISKIRNMKYEIIHVSNIEELKKAFPGQRIYCHFMFKATKQ